MFASIEKGRLTPGAESAASEPGAGGEGPGAPECPPDTWWRRQREQLSHRSELHSLGRKLESADRSETVPVRPAPAANGRKYQATAGGPYRTPVVHGDVDETALKSAAGEGDRVPRDTFR
jgi:hypothetical protein